MAQDTKRKFKFEEQFIDPKTGTVYEDCDSPKIVKTKHFGEVKVHRICRIKWQETKVTQNKYTYDAATGKTSIEKQQVSVFTELMGEKGGWLEKIGNLSQQGDCWVSGGYVVGDALIRDDVQISGGVEVGNNATIADKAKLSGPIGIGGNAYVYGEAKVSGNERIAITGNARCAGEVKGGAIARDNAEVYVGAKLEGNATAQGFAQVFGEIGGNAVVKDTAIVYGKIEGDAQIGGNAIIEETATIKGKVKIAGGIIKGNVEGNVEITSQTGIIDEGSAVKGDVKISGNVIVRGTAEGKSVLSGNVVIGPNSKVEGDSAIAGNVSIRGIPSIETKKEKDSEGKEIEVEVMVEEGGGKVEKGTISGSVLIMGKVKDGAITGGMVGPEGEVEDGNMTGGIVAAGKLKGGELGGNSIIGEGGELSGEMLENGRVSGGDFSGTAEGNGMTTSGSSKEVKGNAILTADGEGAEGNQVYVQDGDDKEPGEAAVICKVEA